MAAALIVLGGLAPMGAGDAGAAGGAGRAPARRPDPVVIVAATFNDQALAEVNYAAMADRLRRDGFRPYVFGLPGGGLTDVEPTAAALAAYVVGVLAETGAERVDLVGHSQGGVVGRYFIRFLGGERVVDAMVSLGAPHYGSEVADVLALGGLWDCLSLSACHQATTTSEFLRALNEPDDTWGAVDYTNVATALDVLVVPHTNALLRSRDGRNVNVVVQDQCPRSQVDHAHLGDDDGVYGAVVDALAGRPVRVDC